MNAFLWQERQAFRMVESRSSGNSVNLQPSHFIEKRSRINDGGFCLYETPQQPCVSCHRASLVQQEEVQLLNRLPQSRTQFDLEP